MFIHEFCVLRKHANFLISVSGLFAFLGLVGGQEASSQKIYTVTNDPNTVTPANRKYDVAIIGGGVVGLAVARALADTRRDLRIVVLEKEDSVAGGASSGERRREAWC
jgi:hypothetical protein